MKLSPKTIAALTGGAVVFTVAAVSHVIYHHQPKPKVRTITDGEGTPVRVLQVGNTFQSATYVALNKRDQPVLEYVKTFDILFDFGLPINSLLALGAGGCVYPLHVLATHPEVKIDAVEADPRIAALARNHFFVDEADQKENFNLHVADGLDFLMQAKEDGTTYSAIINDCFDGKKPDKSLLSTSALELASQCLEDGGLYLINVSTTHHGKCKVGLKATTKALKKVFAHVYTFPCTDEEFGQEHNYVVVATNKDYQL